MILNMEGTSCLSALNIWPNLVWYFNDFFQFNITVDEVCALLGY